MINYSFIWFIGMDNSNLVYIQSLVKERNYYKYITSLFAKEAIRNDLLTIYAFDSEISRIPFISTEPMIGLIRLTFWKENIEKLYNGVKPTEPILSEIMQLKDKYTIPQELFVNIIEAKEYLVEREILGSFAAMKENSIKGTGSLFKIISIISGENLQDDIIEEIALAYDLAISLLKMKEFHFYNITPLPYGFTDIKKICEFILNKINNVAINSSNFHIFAYLIYFKYSIKLLIKNNYDLLEANLEPNRFLLLLDLYLKSFVNKL